MKYFRSEKRGIEQTAPIHRFPSIFCTAVKEMISSELFTSTSKVFNMLIFFEAQEQECNLVMLISDLFKWGEMCTLGLALQIKHRKYYPSYTSLTYSIFTYLIFAKYCILSESMFFLLYSNTTF